MKKSQFIEIISSFFIDGIDCELTGGHVDYISESILTFFEEMGFRPPLTINPKLKNKYTDFDEFSFKKLNNNLVDTSDKGLMFYVNEWDEE